MDSHGIIDKRTLKKEVRKIIDDLSCDPCYQKGDDCCDDFRKHESDVVIHVTPSDRTRWDNKSDFSGSYNDLRDKPDLSDYYPSSGGALTGNIIERNTDSDHLGISGSYWGHGAYLCLSGQNSGYGGAWYLSARDTEKSCDLIGSPAGVLSWGGKLVATEDDLARKADKSDLSAYLPISGGQMTGSVISRDTDDESIVLFGGTAWGKGASLTVNGKGNSNNPGAFTLESHDGSFYSSLVGKPDGSLTWRSKNIDVIEEQGDGYIRYTNGIQLCWGTNTNNNNVDTGISQVNFAKGFSETPSVVVNMSTTTDTLYYACQAHNLSTTYFLAYCYLIVNSLRTQDPFTFSWQAIGKWK